MAANNPIRNICLVLRYDGTAYHGWQSQKNALSVQEVLEKAIFDSLKEDVQYTLSLG